MPDGQPLTAERAKVIVGLLDNRERLQAVLAPSAAGEQLGFTIWTAPTKANPGGRQILSSGEIITDISPVIRKIIAETECRLLMLGAVLP